MSGRHVGRRAVAGSGVAMLVLAAAAAAGQAKAEELDGELLSNADELFRLEAEYMRLRPLIRSLKPEDQPAAEAAFEYADKHLWDRQDEIIDEMIVTPARTPEGIVAKARALELWLNRRVPVAIADTFDDCAEGHEALAMSLARDVLGRQA
jgi:hypothetical protein